MNQTVNESRDEIAIVSARAKRQFPDYLVDAAYPVGWPVYTVRLTLTVLEEQEISAVGRYILRLAALGPAEPAEFSRLLGLSDKFVIGAAAELLSGELARQRPDLKLEITDKGKQAVERGGRSWAPRRKHILVPFDPITRQIQDIEINRNDLIYNDEARKDSLFVVPASGDKPRMSELRLEEIRDYARSEEGIKETEITDVSEIHNRDARLRYRKDITVVKLTPIGGGSTTYAAFLGRKYLEDETIALQRLADSGVDLVPEEFAPSPAAPWAKSHTATATEDNLLSAIQKADLAVSEADHSIAEAQDNQTDDQNIGNNEEMTVTLARLNFEKAELAHRLAEREQQLKEQANGEIRLIKTEEHRPLLLNAIDQAQTQLTLVSAWIGPDAFDVEICDKLRRAMERGVIVRIAWGLGTRRGPEADRNRARGETALKKLTRSIPPELQGQLIEKRTETHEKFIICDDRFCVSGSFNWLSYRGARGRGYRRETSFYSERPADIDLWQANAASLFR